MSKPLPPGLRAHQKAQRRQSEQAILDAAADLFVAQGYERTSMVQLAKAAGVSPATLYKAFPSKEALFRQMVDKELQAARVPFEDGVPSFETAREAGLFIVGRLKFVMTETRILGLTWLALAEGRHFPEMAILYRTEDGQDQTQALGEYVFASLIEQGLFKPCDIPTAVRQFLGMVNHALINEALTRGSPVPDLDRYLEACVDLFCEQYAA